MRSGVSGANHELFKVYSGSSLLYTGFGFADDEIHVTEQCLLSSKYNQYNLELVGSSGNAWSSDSYLAIYGKYDNAVFKSALTRMNKKFNAISLYYGIEKDVTWKMTSGSVTNGWTAYSFSDSTWSDVTLGSVTTTVSGTQYFRKQFVGLGFMAAYDVRLYYKAGVIAYINGAEVYRDNMPAGDASSTTAATGEYTELAYRGFIRPGSEVASQQSILVVEIHFFNPQTTVDFNAYLAILAASTTEKGSCLMDADSSSIQSPIYGHLRGILSKISVKSVPTNLKYESSLYNLVMGTNVYIPAPTYVNTIDLFYLGEGISLPEGLTLNYMTGEITGVPTEMSSMKTYTIYGKNQDGVTYTTITISVRMATCKAEGMFPTSDVGTSYLITDCASQGDYEGEIRRVCVIGSTDGVWETVGECKPIGGGGDGSQEGDNPSSGKKLSSTTIIIIIACIVVFLIVICVCIIACYKHKNKGARGSEANSAKKLPIKNKDNPV